MSYLASQLAITPFGTGTPASADAPPDVKDFEAKYLNPASRDNELASDGSFKRMPRTRQRVLITLTTRKGSSAINPSFGLRMPPKVGTGYERQVKTAVQQALQYLIDDGSISLDGVTVETGEFGRVRLTVSYTDLYTGERTTDSLVI